MTANMHPPEAAHVSALVDLRSLPEDQRVAFYGAMLAIAAVNGTFKWDELDLIFETIHTAGLSEAAKRTIWDYLVDTPMLTACLDRFSGSNAQIRCALMVSLTEIAVADHLLDVSEEAALLQARRTLHISQQQIEAVERYICEGGLNRTRPSAYHEAATALKHGASVLTALSIPATVLYFSGTISGASLLEMLSKLAPQHSGLTMIFDIGIAILIGTAAFLSGRWLRACSTRKRTTSTHKRAQLAVQNLQEAVDYLTTKTNQLAPAGFPSDPDKDPSNAFAERLRMLQHMLARRQATVAAL
jgi:uncharacterized tellurite resistance protein B-like protein